MVSVIIPCYNDEVYVIDALESVRKQTALDAVTDIIVINDGSTDNSQAAVEKYIAENPTLPITLINKPNGGLASARNAGMRIAKGRYIALLDSDDEWLPDKLEWQLSLLKEHPEIDYLGGGADDSGQLRILFKKVTGLYKASMEDILIKFIPFCPTIIFKRELLDTVGYYNENYRYVEDGDFSYRIIRVAGYYYHPRKVCELGHGKRSFGQSGLSGNLREMYKGCVRGYKDVWAHRDVSLPFYVFLRVYSFAKYIRRILISKFSKR